VLSGASGTTGPPPSASHDDIDITCAKNFTPLLRARVLNNGADITQAAISSITYSVYQLDPDNIDTRTAIAAHTAVSVTTASVVFDTLQTDSQVARYNFKHQLATATTPFTTAGADYLVEYTVTPTSGEKIPIRFKVNVI